MNGEKDSHLILLHLHIHVAEFRRTPSFFAMLSKDCLTNLIDIVFKVHFEQ